MSNLETAGCVVLAIAVVFVWPLFVDWTTDKAKQALRK